MSAKKSQSRKNLVYGVHPIVEAIQAGRSLDKIMIRKGVNKDRIRDLLNLSQDLSIPVQSVPEVTINRLCPNVNHQGIIAFISEVVYQSLENIILKVTEKGQVPLFLLLDGITDVRNFGAIARSAECMGANAIIMPMSGAAPTNADAVKVSAGALHHLDVCREKNLVDSILMLQSYGITTIACTEKAGEHIYAADLTGPTCLIMGSEEKGISSTILKRADQLAKIPLVGQVSSLNVSVATGMILSEASRQRNFS
jgi:23S rRNA (guanosine2251-2'-O)-methyltransferase